MKNFSRRDFLLSTGGIFALSSFRNSIPPMLKPLKLSFSTLGCPAWTLEQVTDFAVANKYQGVEIRGINKVLDLFASPYFDTPEHIAATKAQFKKKKLKITDLGASAELSFKDPAVREKNLDNARKYIDLAQALGSPYIRVFPNHFPKDQTKEETMKLIIDGFKSLSDYARPKNVSVLMETHGDLIHTDDVVAVMKEVPPDNTGLVWDIMNMWTTTREDPADVYPKLKKYVKHTHIKDMVMEGDKINYKLMGQGQTPIFAAIDLLLKDGYPGFYSFEWEKLWHPEIAEPEIALAQYSQAMLDHYNKMK